MAAQRFRLAVRTVLVTYRASLRDAPLRVLPSLRGRAEALLTSLEPEVASPAERELLDDAYRTVRLEGRRAGPAAEDVDDRIARPRADAKTDPSPSTSQDESHHGTSHGGL
jgi:hypothetical protein